MSKEEYNSQILLTNIQRFCLHDGPGIRTTIFLKGCNIHCPWCSNPENIKGEVQKYVRDGRCDTYGAWYTQENIYQEVLKDIEFYKGGIQQDKWTIINADQIEYLPGGVTFSGGEPLLQMHKFIPFLEKLKKENIHMAIETSLYAAIEDIQAALSYIDFFYIDIKILNRNIVKDILHGNLNIFLNNFDRVFRWKDVNGNFKPIVVRIPVIGGYTDMTNNRRAIKALLQSYINLNRKPLKVELIKGHNLGNGKYKSLELQVPEYREVSNEVLLRYKNELEEIGLVVEVCKI